jgi:hypothetical protein
MPYDDESELEVSQGYLTSELTDHIRETPEGFLIVADCPVARTGFQQYAIRDLPQKRAADLGVDISNPSATIDLYRPEEEVFHPEFLASLEGKPVTDGHPPGFVTPENFSQYAMGHVQNVRRGPEPMEDGEWPILADLVISAEPLVGKIKRKEAREVSLGYDYGIDRDGERINQVNMLANHNAVVPKGRAGDLIAIGDHAGEVDVGAAAHLAALDAAVLDAQVSEVPLVAAAVEAPTYKPIVLPTATKEKRPVANKTDWFRLFKGKHLIEMARATDADPEKIVDAAEAIQPEEKEEAADLETISRKPEAGAARDAHRKALHDALDAMMDGGGKARDRRVLGKGAVGDALKDLSVEELKTEIQRLTEMRSQGRGDQVQNLLRHLEDLLDSKKKARDRRASDEDIEELKGLLKDAFGEEDVETEPEQQTLDADPSEIEELVGAGEAPDAEDDGHAEGCEDPDCPGCDEADPGEELEPSGEEALEDRRPANDSRRVPPNRRRAVERAPAADAAAGVKAVLKMLRPFVARANDDALSTAFNTALSATTRSSRASSGGGYGAFTRHAADRSNAPRNPNPSPRARAADAATANAKLQKAYDDIRLGVVKGGK